jgi:hypothetical protein
MTMVRIKNDFCQVLEAASNAWMIGQFEFGLRLI